MTAIRACFPKLGHFFQNLEKGQGKTLLPTPSSYTPGTTSMKRCSISSYQHQSSNQQKPLSVHIKSTSLFLQGKFIATIQSQYQQILTTFHFAKGNGISILVRTTSENFARRYTNFSTRYQDHQSRQPTSR